MGKKFVVLMWPLLALLVAVGSRAEMVTDLHSATVPVEDQTSNTLAAASRQAMSDVLVKVSGSSQLLRNPNIVAALGKARSHVQQYSYVRGKPPAPKLSVRFEFDGAYITDLVTGAGAPLWTANRPLVLAWVVVEDEEGRHFVNQDSSPEQAQMLVDAFAQRGVPVQLPVFDLADSAALSPEDVWGMNANAILAASARYNVQNVVAGRFANLEGKQTSGHWSYFFQDSRVNRSVEAADLQDFGRDGATIVAGEMSARYAVAPTGGEAGGVRMSVDGISNYADYAAVVSWLQNLELVDEANIEQVQGDRIELRLQAKTDASQLATLIELNNRLVPMPAAASDAQLNYRWQK